MIVIAMVAMAATPSRSRRRHGRDIGVADSIPSRRGREPGVFGHRGGFGSFAIGRNSMRARREEVRVADTERPSERRSEGSCTLRRGRTANSRSERGAELHRTAPHCTVQHCTPHITAPRSAPSCAAGVLPWWWDQSASAARGCSRALTAPAQSPQGTPVGGGTARQKVRKAEYVQRIHTRGCECTNPPKHVYYEASVALKQAGNPRGS
eukprot:1189784-Prorocentrum_minimum.AAC.1